MEPIPYGRQTIEEDDIAAVVGALKSDFLTTGPKVAEFEALLCEKTGARYAAAVSNGTAALHIAALALGIKQGDEVILPPLTFAATANCVLYCGGKPVFADIDPDTLLMDTESLLSKINGNTKAVIPVHYAGETCDMTSLAALARERGLDIIQDAAHALGSLSGGKNLGCFPGVQAWSFHPVKTVTTGEGGAVTTGDKNIYDKLIRLRTHGITRDSAQWHGGGESGGWYYEQLDLGFNYRLTDIQCALGISQLKKLSRFAERRGEIVKYYNEAFSGVPVRVQKTPGWSSPVRHLYTVRVKDSSERTRVYNFLRSKNILVNAHYIPVYLMPYYKGLGYAPGLCPNAEAAYSSLVSLPLYPAMTDAQVEYVAQSVREAVSG